MNHTLSEISSHLNSLKRTERKSPDSLVERLRIGDSESVIDASRSLRNKGFRGAVFYELMGWLIHPERVKILSLANALESISDRDLFDVSADLRSPPLPPNYIEAARWVLSCELNKRSLQGVSRNPALRIQLLAILDSFKRAAIIQDEPSVLLDAARGLMQSGLDVSDIKVAVVELLTALDRPAKALDLIYRDLGPAQPPMISRGAHRIFSSIPHRERTTLAFGHLEFGIAPIEGCGFLAKAYLGQCWPMRASETDIAKPVAPVYFVPWIPGWNQKWGPTLVWNLVARNFGAAPIRLSASEARHLSRVVARSKQLGLSQREARLVAA
ncbi:MAG: hypothetical protein IPJ84_15220 [Bdellovibrionales bacterium]|nr:hypothetical protein [Bdellovibrionales bacterium]